MSVEKELIWERYEFLKMSHEFYHQTGFMKKQVEITFQGIQTDIQVFVSEI